MKFLSSSPTAKLIVRPQDLDHEEHCFLQRQRRKLAGGNGVVGKELAVDVGVLVDLAVQQLHAGVKRGFGADWAFGGGIWSPSSFPLLEIDLQDRLGTRLKRG